MSADPAQQAHVRPGDGASPRNAEPITVLPPFIEAFPELDLLRPDRTFAPALPPPLGVAPSLDAAKQLRHQSDMFTPRNAAPPGHTVTGGVFALVASDMARSSGRAPSTRGHGGLGTPHMPYDPGDHPAARSPPDDARSFVMPLQPQRPYAHSPRDIGPYQSPPPVSQPHCSSRSTSESVSAPPLSKANPSHLIDLPFGGPNAGGADPLDVAAYSRVPHTQAKSALHARRPPIASRIHLGVQDGGGTSDGEEELFEGSGALSRGPNRRGRCIRPSNARIITCPWPGCNKTYTSVGNINRHGRTEHGNHPPPQR